MSDEKKPEAAISVVISPENFDDLLERVDAFEGWSEEQIQEWQRHAHGTDISRLN